MMVFKSMIVVLIATLCFVYPSFAEYDPEPNRIGIYFDTNASYPCVEFLGGALFIPVTTYLILTNPTYPEIYGWEATLQSVDGELVSGVSTISGGGVNTGEGLEFIVSYDTPLLTSPLTLLATVDLYFMAWYECLYLTGITQPAIPDSLPLVWPQENSPVAIQPTQLFPNGVGAVLGACSHIIGYPAPCDDSVSIETIDWGVLKALYR